MEQEVNFNKQVQLIFGENSPSPAVVKKALQAITELKKDGALKDFLAYLINNVKIINTYNLFKFMRYIKQAVIQSKNEETTQAYIRLVIAITKKYVKGKIIGDKKIKHIKQFEKLLWNIKTDKFIDQNDNLVLNLLSATRGKRSQTLEQTIMQKLKSEVFVDTRNRSDDAIPLNSLFAKTIVSNFKQVFDTLKRLLARSSSNLSLWQQVSDAIKDSNLSGQLPFQCFNLLQEHLSQNSDECILIIKNLTSNLTDQQTITKLLDTIDKLIAKTYDQSKKIIYIRMLTGAIKSSTKYQSTRNKAFELLIDLVPLTTSEQIYLELSPIVRLFTRFAKNQVNVEQKVIVNMSKQIKDLSKYGCIILSNLITEENISQEVRKSKASEIFVKQFTSVYEKSKNSMGMNTESYLAAVQVLITFNKDQEFSQLAEANYLTNFAFVSQKSETNNHFLRVILKAIVNLPKLDHSYQFLAMSIYVALCNTSQSLQKIAKSLTKSNVFWLIAEGAYPIVFFQYQRVLKLKKNRQQIVINELLKYVKNDQQFSVKLIDWERVLSVLPYFRVNIHELLNKKCSKQIQLIKENIKGRISEVVNIILDEQFEIARQNVIYMNFLQSTFILGLYESLNPYIDIFFNNKLYTDVKSLNEFDQKLQESCSKQNNRIVEEKQKLTENQYPVKGKAAKVSVEEELKMLDQNQVKQQILRKHYNKMVQYYTKLMAIIKTSMKNHDFQKYISTKYGELLKCQKDFAELRFEFYLFNRQLFNNEPQYQRFSGFLSELYLNVGMYTLPTAALLDKLNKFMEALITQELKDVPAHFIKILEYLTQYILRESLDISLKVFSEKFYIRLAKQGRFQQALVNIYPLLIQNINLLSQFPETRSILIEVLQVIPESRIEEVLDDLMNYLPTSQKAVLSAVVLSNRNHQLNFQDYVKLRILEVQDNEISKLAKELLGKCSIVLDKERLEKFKMKRFVQRHSKEVSEKLCSFAKEVISKDATTVQKFFDKAIDTARSLYQQKFDQQGLEFYPSFLLINNEFIPSNRLEAIFEVLIKHYTSDDQMVTLNKRSMQAGISIIKTYGKQQSEQLLAILEKLMKANTQGISSIIFLGVLAPFLKQAKNMNLIQKRITQIFDSKNVYIQSSVAKCMHQLMSFFEKPKQLVAELYKKITTTDSDDQVGKSYLVSGLLKGIGIKQLLEYLNKVLEPSDPKNFIEKKGKLQILTAFIDNFGRVIQPRISQVIKMIAICMSDNNNEVIRDNAKSTAKLIISKLSAFGVKIILPQLLTGLEEQQHWRGKTTYIWILGNMSHCAPRQLHTCLPKIIPTLSACLSDTHPKIRETATEALKVIGQTIKNPQIFSIIDILINALSDLFNNSKKALQVLLKTKFGHFIDPPALSVIVPILNYALRGRDTVLKQYACQVIGGVVFLIENPQDLLPYFEFLAQGIRITLCDPLPDVREYASRAIGKISSKIGIKNTQNHLPFLKSILASETATSIQRYGAAQGLSEYICSHGIEFFEQQLNQIYKKLSVAKHSQKQGYISIFIYIPNIMKQDFQPFIKQLTDNMTIFVSDEEQSIRNSSLNVQKILISNYGLSHTQMLLEPLELSLFEAKWRKRNGALLLIGEMLNVLKNYLYENTDAEKQSSYYEALMGVYIIKDDEVQMPRITANQVWNTYIENTPKTIKCGIPFLVRMWSKGISEPASNVVYRNIVGFCTKYAETYFTEIITNLQRYLEDPTFQSGAFEVLAEFIKRMANIFLSKFRNSLAAIFDKYIFEKHETKPKIIQALSIFVQKMHESEYFESKLIPILEKCDTLSQQSEEFSNYLHLISAFCQTSSKSISQLVATKVLETPLSEFKIQVLQNNSTRLANFAYSKGIIKVFKSELQTEIEKDSTRLKSLLYCLKELSVSMDAKNQNEFLKDLTTDIRNISDKSFNELSTKQQKLLEAHLDILNHYLETISADETPSLEELIQQISPLCIVQKQTLTPIINKIIMRLFMHPDNRTKAAFFKQFIVCMENSGTIKDSKVIPIWASEESVKSYTTLFINSFCYGGIQAFDSTLSIIQTFFKIANPQFIKSQSIRFIGATLRVSNYRMTKNQRQNLHEFIHYLYINKFPMQNFQYQVVFTLIKFLEETEDDSNILLTSNNFAELLIVSNKKNEVLTEFVTQIGKGKQHLIKCLFYLIKRVLKDDIIGEAILSKLYNDLHRILGEKSDLEIDSVYYLSKTASRLAIHLHISKDKLSVPLQGVTFSYVQTLQYLHHCYYEQSYPDLIEKINVFLKDSSREKVHYLLRTLIDLSKKQPKIKEKYSQQILKGMINESILGFEEIEQCLKDLAV